MKRSFKPFLLLALAAASVSSVLAASAPPPPLQVCLDQQCVSSSSPGKSAAGSGAIKWNPGHYASLNGLIRRGNSDSLLKTHLAHIALLANEPTVAGVKIDMQWSALEGDTPGDYTAGMAVVQQYLDAVAKANKQLMVVLFDRQFSYNTFTTADLTNLSKLETFFPKYLASGSQYGISLMHNGLTTRIWQPATMDRMIAMVRAYGTRFNSHPNFEMFTAGETAVSSANAADGYSHAALAVQLKRLNVAARQAWPNTAFRVSTNFLGNDAIFIDYIANMAQHQLTFGGPDVIPNHSIQANNILSGKLGGKDYRVSHPITAEIQAPQLGGSKGTWTPKQLYDWAMSEVRPQYFVWLRNDWSGGDAQKWDTGILPFIRSVGGRVYSTTCPTNYSNGCK